MKCPLSPIPLWSAECLMHQENLLYGERTRSTIHYLKSTLVVGMLPLQSSRRCETNPRKHVLVTASIFRTFGFHSWVCLAQQHKSSSTVCDAILYASPSSSEGGPRLALSFPLFCYYARAGQPIRGLYVGLIWFVILVWAVSCG